MRFSYGPNAKQIMPWAEAIIEEILIRAGIAGAIVTSTKRTPADQARIMYANLNGPGLDRRRYIERQLRLYGDNGDLVIRVFEQQLAIGATAADTMHAMEQKIIQLGPQKVSAHCIDDADREVLDIAPLSIPDSRKKAFESAVSSASGVTKFIKYPIDPAYHIELKKG